MARDIEHYMPRAPLWVLDWAGIVGQYPWMSALRGSIQDPVHHAEGDVLTHVGMVVEHMVASAEWRALPHAGRLETFAAALLHDVCKPQTMRVEDGRITNRGHSRAGANEARQILWRMGWDIAARERVCSMIRVHQAPFWLLEREPWEVNRILVETSLGVSNRMLAVLAEADARGRICADSQKIIDAVELYREAAREVGCYDGPYAFYNDHSRFRYFCSPQTRRPDTAFHDDTDTGFCVTVMSGLPAMGKSTWIARETAPGGMLAGQPVVSLDGLRAEFDVDATDNQGSIIQMARQRAREHLRAGQSFVWDGTNLSRQLRGQTTALAADYGARVDIAYVEVSEAEMQARNRARTQRVPDAAIERMLRRWEMPGLAECHGLHIHRPEPVAARTAVHRG